METPIHLIEVRIGESFPPQISVYVEGELPDGCSEFNPVSATQDGNQITISITSRRVTDAPACSNAAQSYDVTIPLRGDFPPGRYTVTVNGVSEEFEV